MTAPARCPVHDTSLKMWRKYLIAPSVAFCELCLKTYDVEYDYDAAEWRVIDADVPTLP
jgi:hypothetical protein